MKRRDLGLSDIISTLTVAVLFVVILMLVVFSASSYQNATVRQSDHDNARAVLSYVATAVHGNGQGEVKPQDLEGNPGLSIADGDTGYEQRIYLHEGELLQEYGKAGAGIDPEHAMVIGKAREFDVSYVNDDVLQIRTDLGTSYVNTVR